MSQLDFAKKIGFTQGAISKIEKGKTKRVSRRLLDAIYARFPELNPDWLEKAEGTMFVSRGKETYEIREAPLPYPSNASSSYDSTRTLTSLVEEIMRSDDEGTKLALAQNIRMFHEKIEEKKKLLKRIDALEKAFHPYVPGGSEAQEE